MGDPIEVPTEEGFWWVMHLDGDDAGKLDVVWALPRQLDYYGIVEYLSAVPSPKELADTQERIGVLEGALKKAGEVFDHYVSLHKAKHTLAGDGKAEANDQHASDCRAALGRGDQST